jgi:lysophospholipase L1-like esterase
MERRKFDSQGKLAQSLTAYADAARQVAEEQNVFLIDLHAESVRLFNAQGEEATNYINCSAEDRTHWSPEGAKLWANKVISRLRQAGEPYCPLVSSLK